MEPIYIAAIASFFAGLFGYIIIRFWVIPIGKYVKTKSRLGTDIKALLNLLPAQDLQFDGDSREIQNLKLSIRRLCSDLVSIYDNDLPYWYRLYLESKAEKPQDAADFSMRLANTRKPEHMQRQTDEIKRLLRLQ